MDYNEITPQEFIKDLYYIKTKEGSLVKFKFNHAQKELYKIFEDNYDVKPLRIIVLKARQLGISTFTEAMITYLTTNNPNTDAIILAHMAESSAKIYEMTQLFVDCLPQSLKPTQKYSNRKMLAFDNERGNGLKSSIRVMVANESTRGGTYKLAHLSELAFWEDPETAMTALMQTIPNTNDSVVVIESTANGFNYFYNLWQDATNGRNDFIPIFFPWYVDPEYKMPYTGFEKTPYELDIQARFNLTDEQLEWRRWAIRNNCNNDELKFRQEYPITPEEAFIVSGTGVFNNEQILNHLKEVPGPIKVGYFDYRYDGLTIANIRWVDDPKGFIKIYKEFDGTNTAIGGDTAGGGEDFFVAQVLDREGNQVAVLHHKFDEDLYAKQVYCLGMHYHSLVAIETNFSTYPNMELRRLRYPWLFIRERNYDAGFRDDVQEKFGFKTTQLTRPNIISQLVEIAREHMDKIIDRETLQEMLSFVYLKGKPQASEGAHDDLVMALAIAYEALKQLPNRRMNYQNTEKKPKSRVKNHDDEDFFSFGM